MAELVAVLLENVDWWLQEFPTQGKPIFLGVSQGGDMCFTLAARYRDQFALCLPIAGRLLTREVIGKENGGRVRIHHGNADPIVLLERAYEAAKTLLLVQVDVKIKCMRG